MPMSANPPIRIRLAPIAVVCAIALFGPVFEAALGGGGRGWTLGALLLAVAPTLMRPGGPRFDPIDPETYVPASYVLSALYAPALHLLRSPVHTLDPSETSATRVAFLGAAGCAVVCAGLTVNLPSAPQSHLHRPPRVSVEDWAVVTVGIVGATLVATWFVWVGVSTVFSLDYASTYLREDGFGMLVAGWQVIQYAAVFLTIRVVTLRIAARPVPVALYVALISFCAVFLINTALGRRGPLVWLGVACLLGAHSVGARLRRRTLVALAAVVLTYSYLIEGARTEQGRGFDRQIEAAQEYVQDVRDPLAIPDVENLFRNLVTVTREKIPLVRYPGESWINAVLIAIPKPLYPDRPLALSQRFVRFVAPGFARAGGGYAFSATAEGYVNFGLAGVFIEVAAMTLLYFGGLAYCMRGRASTLLAPALISFAAFAYNQYRGEMASMLKLLVAFLVAYWLALLVQSVLRLVVATSAAGLDARAIASPREPAANRAKIEVV